MGVHNSYFFVGESLQCNTITLPRLLPFCGNRYDKNGQIIINPRGKKFNKKNIKITVNSGRGIWPRQRSRDFETKCWYVQICFSQKLFLYYVFWAQDLITVTDTWRFTVIKSLTDQNTDRKIYFCRCESYVDVSIKVPLSRTKRIPNSFSVFRRFV